MKRKRIVSIISLLLGSVLLVACAKTGEVSSEATETAGPGANVEVPEGELTLGEPSGEMPAMGEPPAGWNGEGQPPEPPEGMGNPPDGRGEPPEGRNGEGQPPEPPEGMGNPPDGMGQPPQGGPGGHGGQGGPGGSAASVAYTAANTVTAAITESGKTYASATAGENALLIATSDSVTVENPTVTKSGDSNGGDACSFYGLNAAILCKDGADVTITGGTILVGSDSELTLSLTGGSTFTGAISGAITNARGETVSTDIGTVHVTIDASSTWTLTADTYISSFEGDVSSIVANGFSLYVNGERIA